MNIKPLMDAKEGVVKVQRPTTGMDQRIKFLQSQRSASEPQNTPERLPARPRAIRIIPNKSGLNDNWFSSCVKHTEKRPRSISSIKLPSVASRSARRMASAQIATTRPRPARWSHKASLERSGDVWRCWAIMSGKTRGVGVVHQLVVHLVNMPSMNQSRAYCGHLHSSDAWSPWLATCEWPSQLRRLKFSCVQRRSGDASTLQPSRCALT